MKELLIIRHARSEHNAKISTSLDSPITNYGRRTCEETKKFLRNNFGMIGFSFFTSPFLRCLMTSSLIFPEEQFNVDWSLREYLNHSGEQVYIPNRKCEFGKYNWSQHYSQTFFTEQNEEFLNRMYSAYEILPEKSIVVTHGLPALTLLKIATEEGINSVPIWDHSLDNCSLTYIRGKRIIWRGRNLHHEKEF